VFEKRRLVFWKWNIVPWYVGTTDKIRPVRMSDIEQAIPFLERLLGLLEELRVIVLVGRKAQSATSRISRITHLPIIHSYHPSNLSLHSDPNRYSDILQKLQEARIAALGLRP
jgi:uracil-DNA glycosylase